MNLVEKQNPLCGRQKYRVQLSGIGQALGQDLGEWHRHFFGQHRNQRTFSQPRRAAQQNLIQPLPFLKTGIDGDPESLGDVLLSDDMREARWLDIPQIVPRLVVVHLYLQFRSWVSGTCRLVKGVGMQQVGVPKRRRRGTGSLHRRRYKICTGSSGLLITQCLKGGFQIVFIGPTPLVGHVFEGVVSMIGKPTEDIRLPVFRQGEFLL